MRIAIAGATGTAGRALVRAAGAAGHDVLPLSPAHGVDVFTGSGLDLAGADAVVDVTQVPMNDPWRDASRARPFFEAVARTLGEAAHAAGVPRTVVLSVLGIDRTPDDGLGIHEYYAAKRAHEAATLRHAPGPRILRSAQFHELVARMVDWKSDGVRAEVPDMLVQPVAADDVAATLLELAVALEAPVLTELAGPRAERMPDLVARLDETLLVSPAPVSPSLAQGALLPGPDAITAARGFDDWLLTPVES